MLADPQCPTDDDLIALTIVRVHSAMADALRRHGVTRDQIDPEVAKRLDGDRSTVGDMAYLAALAGIPTSELVSHQS